MRPIDADLAIEELTDRSHQAAKRVGTDSPFWEGLVIARRIVRNLPTIQPERAEGEWVLKDYLWECNKCGCRINVKNPLCDNNWNYYFCPHCGTKMTIAVQRF